MTLSSYTAPLWRHRHFVLQSIRNDYRVRFARSRIGLAWMVLHPLIMALVYALVLSEVLSLKLAGVESSAGYALYLLSGIVIWNLFSETLGRAVTMFVDSASFLKKIAVPKVAVPAIVVGCTTVNFCLLFVVITGIYIAYGQYPSLSWLLLIIPTLIALAMGISFGVLLGVMNVFARDVGQVMLVVLNIWFWLTPIVYSVDMVPDGMGTFIQFNPMFAITKYYQDVMVYGRVPDMSSLLYPTLLVLGIALVAVTFFRRASAEIVDAL